VLFRPNAGEAVVRSVLESLKDECAGPFYCQGVGPSRRRVVGFEDRPREPGRPVAFGDMTRDLPLIITAPISPAELSAYPSLLPELMSFDMFG
jgi:hypothetical protein